MAAMLEGLNRNERLRLMKFICAFAWADLQVKPEEVGFVARIFRQLDLDDLDWHEVKGWLDVPPEPEAIDPTQIPEAHRRTFVACIEQIISADAEVSEMEREQLVLFKQLLV